MTNESNLPGASILADTKAMIDGLKTVCANAGLANDSSEYKIITEAFLYKFLNDKFLHELRKIDRFKDSGDIEADYSAMDEDAREFELVDLPAGTAVIRPEYLISYLFNRKNRDGFAELFDRALTGISNDNVDVFAVKTGQGQSIRLFSGVSRFIVEEGKRDNFCAQLITKLAGFSFERAFAEKYDFFAAVFEYLISDYNKDSGTYGEYFTPHSIATIIVRILVPDGATDVTVYDPAAGTGTLVLAAAHRIGEDKCTIYTQDRSQKANEFMRLNLILNNLVHSLPNVVHDDTLENPRHLSADKRTIRQFDYIVSNPPFNCDFSDNREKLAGEAYRKRFWAGVPRVPAKKKEGMAIYLLFLQHIIKSMKNSSKAAIVVPSGFLTDSSAISTTIREHILNNKMLHAVVQMPAMVFANTNTSVSILFLDAGRDSETAMLVDASKMGTTIKIDDKARVVLSQEDRDYIVSVVNEKRVVAEFSKEVTYEEICSMNQGDQYRALFKPGLYFGMSYRLLSDYEEPIDDREAEYLQKQRALMRQLSNAYSRNLFIDWFVEFGFPGASETKKTSEYGEIPANSHLTALSAIATNVSGDWGKDEMTGNYTELIRCIRGADIPKVGIADYSGVPFRYVLPRNASAKQLKPGDIIIEISGGSPTQSTGRVCYVSDEMLSDLRIPVLCTNFCRVIRLNDTLLSKYVYDYLQLLYDRGYYFNLENNTTGIKNLLLGPFMNSIKILIPDDVSVISQYYETVKKYEAEVTARQ